LTTQPQISESVHNSGKALFHVTKPERRQKRPKKTAEVGSSRAKQARQLTRSVHYYAVNLARPSAKIAGWGERTVSWRKGFEGEKHVNGALVECALTPIELIEERNLTSLGTVRKWCLSMTGRRNLPGKIIPGMFRDRKK